MIKSIFSGANGLGRRLFVLSVLAIGIAVLSPLANAGIMSFCASGAADPVVNPIVTPCFANGQAPGTLLASLSAPFTSSLGLNTGTLISAVYKESGGTLDFYYQVINNTTSTNCPSAGHPTCDNINRETDTDFTGFLTELAFRSDCATPVGMGTLCAPFANGDTAPQQGDRLSADVAGFTFNAPPGFTPLMPGHTSNVLIVSTNATNFRSGNASVIDGGTTTVASFQPTSATPEPASLALVGLGLLGLAGLRRRIQSRR